ncbi:peptide MFS transporter [Crocinitomicaceae bacterium]|nr:peptide MFS transporter [Crocinitomicaceae bacterium]
MSNTIQKGHPGGLYLLFTVEMWERFSYYGMRAIFILYLTKALLMDTEAAGSIYGIYTSLVYATPLLGGFIADRYWGNRRSILVGGILMAIAQFLMFFSASAYGDPSSSIPIMYASLGFLILGNGFFKPNISSMVGTLYPKGDSRVDSAYTIFYMGINAGALVAPLVCGGLGDTGSAADFKWGFLCAGIGMVIGTIIMLLGQNKYIVDPEGEPIGMKPSFYKDKRAAEGKTEEETKEVLTKVEKDRIWAIFIITAFVIAFWAAFEQAGASLTIFADQNTDRGLFGFTVPASFFQSINPIFIVMFAPIFSVLWSTLASRGKEPSSPMKMVWGLALLALGYVVITFSVKDMGMESKISMFFLIGMYFLHTCGELAISPVGLSVVNKLSPRRFASMMMAVFFLSSVVGNFTAGLFSGIIPQPEVKEILYVENSGYSAEDIQLYTANLITKSDNPLEGCLTKSYRKINTKFEDNKLADNKKRYSKKDATNLNAMLLFEGQDSLNISFTNAANTAKDLRSEKTVAAYAKNKDVMVRDVVINGQHVASYVFQNSQKQIFGMKINTLYSFFIIFIVMAGATSILLLLLHKRLEKLMHGIR